LQHIVFSLNQTEACEPKQRLRSTRAAVRHQSHE
jgi:hypothetical protein